MAQVFSQIDPVVHAYWCWRIRYDGSCEEYLLGYISREQFRRRLFALGFRGEEIEQEITLHESPRRAA